MVDNNHGPKSETTRLLAAIDTSREEQVEEDREDVNEAEDHHGGGAGPVVSTARGFSICLSMALLLLVLTVNISMMTTIQGSIATEFDTATSISWFTSAYLIASTSLIPVAGRLSIIFTRRYYVFVSAVVISTGLLITSQAPSLAVFILGRVVTGLGGATISPLALILVSDLASINRRGLLFGCVNLCYTTGISCGAALAGALEPVLGWRMVFLLQIPFALFAGLLALFTLPKSEHGGGTGGSDDEDGEESSLLQKLSRLDFLGVATLTSSVILLLYGLSTAKVLVLPIILSIVVFLLFLLVEAKWAVHDPILPLGVLSSRGNLLTGLATIGLMTSRWGVLFYAPVSGLAIRGYPPAISGLMLLPTNVGFGTGSLLVGWLHINRSISYYTSVLVCFAVFVASELFLAQTVALTAPISTFLLGLFFNGFTCGALVNYSMAHLLHLTQPSARSFVISLNALFRALSSSFGSSISGGIFLRALSGALTDGFKGQHVKDKADLIRRLLGSPGLVYQLDGPEHVIAVKAYTIAIRTLFIVGAVTSALMLLVQAGTGWTSPKSKEEDENNIQVRQGRTQ